MIDSLTKDNQKQIKRYLNAVSCYNQLESNSCYNQNKDKKIKPSWKIFQNLDAHSLSYPYLELYLTISGRKFTIDDFVGFVAGLNNPVLTDIFSEGLNTPNNIFDEFISDPDIILLIIMKTFFIYYIPSKIMDNVLFDRCKEFWTKKFGLPSITQNLSVHYKRFNYYEILYKKNPKVFWDFYVIFGKKLKLHDLELFEWFRRKLISENKYAI